MKNTIIIALSLLAPAVLSAAAPEQSAPVQKTLKAEHAAVVKAEANRIINPMAATRAHGLAASTSSEVVLNEDFQGWDGDKTNNAGWLPEGWSVKREKSAAGHPGWMVFKPSVYDEIKSTCMVFNFFDEEVDEWLVSPAVKVENGMELSWLSFPTPLYYFDPKYIDYENWVFSELSIINDMKVHVSTDGGLTWTQVKSVAEDYLGIKGYFELYSHTKYKSYVVDLSAFAGQTINVAFQVVGLPEGNSSLVDDVRVGYPQLNISYARPVGSLFFGLSAQDEYLPRSIMTVPVHRDVTFLNTSDDYDADFVWTYEDTEGVKTSTDADALTVKFSTNHESDFSSRNNLYEMPLLSAKADLRATTEFTYPYLLQAGGKGEYERYYTDTEESEVIDLGLGVIDPITEGSATYADIAVPYFGYNPSSDYFWSDYTFLENFPGYDIATNYNHLEKIGNLFFASEHPLVVSGVRVNGYGRLNREAVLKAEIFLLGEDFVMPDKAYATAICTGDDITITDRNATNHILSFNFKFDSPVVLSADLAPCYVVAFSGFRDADNVEYFSPEMSDKENPDGLGLGWTAHEMCYQGQVMPLSWSPVFNYTEELVAFYIMLDAVYPWLEGEQEIELNSEAPAVLALDSYYAADELTVEGAPEWLKVEATGRYGTTALKLSTTAGEPGTAVIKVSAPGVEKTVTVKNTGSSGLATIVAENLSEIEDIYTLSGVKVQGKPVPGVYIVRTTDGKTQKALLR